MTCYFRHLRQVFEKAGVEVTSENKRKIDKVIHAIVGVDYKNCSAAWKEVKKRLADNEEVFISNLKAVWSTKCNEFNNAKATMHTDAR